MSELEKINKLLAKYNKEHKTNFYVTKSAKEDICEMHSLLAKKVNGEIKEIHDIDDFTNNKIHKCWLLKPEEHPLNIVLISTYINVYKRLGLEPYLKNIEVQGKDTSGIVHFTKMDLKGDKQ